MSKSTFRWETKIFLGVFLIGFAFAAFTQHAWEDFFIVLRQAQNLAVGHGLVYQVGERLQCFSSPLGVLLPAAIAWILGATTHESVLWTFRLVSLTALGFAVVLLFQILRKFQQHAFATAMTLLLIALDSKTVDFATNGMETGLLLFFLALTLHGLFLSGPRQWLRIGVGFGGLMWTRPDGCIYIGALALGALMFLPGAASDEPRSRWWKRLLLAGVICAVLYLPWFLWSWWYYGSPVPHSIVAKGANLPPLGIGELLENVVLFPFLKLFEFTPVKIFIPAYAGPDWSLPLLGLSRLLAWITALAWVCPLVKPRARVLSFAVYAGELYLSQVVKMAYPWYLPVVAVMGYMVIGLLFDQCLSAATRLRELGLDRGWLRHLSAAARSAGVALVVGQGIILLCVAREMQVEQTCIEDGVRRQVGLWLRDHANSSMDTVLLEPVGYVGYFSRLRMLDYPGLCSKRVVEVRQRLGPDHQREAWLELKPDWIVLRPQEIEGTSYIDTTHLKEFYQAVVAFDQSERIDAIHLLPGRGMVVTDERFAIFHRKDATNSTPVK